MCVKKINPVAVWKTLEGAIPEVGKLWEYCSKGGRGLNCKIRELEFTKFGIIWWKFTACMSHMGFRLKGALLHTVPQGPKLIGVPLSCAVSCAELSWSPWQGKRWLGCHMPALCLGWEISITSVYSSLSFLPTAVWPEIDTFPHLTEEAGKLGELMECWLSFSVCATV